MLAVPHTFCTDVSNPLLGMFDLSVAPALLSYAYIPLLTILLVFGITVVIRAHFTLKTRSLLVFSVALSLWIVNEIVQWVALYHDVIFGAWRLALPLQAFVMAAWALVASRFFSESKTIRFLAGLSVVVLIASIFSYASPLNMASYDLSACEGVAGSVWIPFYTYQVLLVLMIVHVARRVLGTVPQGMLLMAKRRALMALSIIGISFVAANTIGELTGIYEVNLLIPIGVVLGIGLLLVSAAEYPIFTFKPQISEILIFLSMALVGSLLLVPDLASQRIVIICTMVGLFVLGRVVTRINRRAERQRQQLEEATVRLKEIDQSKNEFLSFATHQMRSPLVSIKWGAETLLDEGVSGQLNDTQRMLGQKIHAVAVAMTDTVNDLLDISKIEQGGLVLKPEPVDLCEFTGTIVSQFQGSAQQKGLQLSYVSNVSGPCMVMADQTKLRQVLVNLIDNSIKYTDHGSISVTVSSDMGMANVSVADTGRGIAPEDREKLFGKFARGKSGSANKGGSGLGLFLAKKIVEMHKGTFEVVSPGEGQGSTFSFMIPLVR